MEDYRINKNYAKALYLTAVEMEQLDTVAKDMRTVSRVCEENRELNTIMANPTIKECKKVGILKGVFEESVSETTIAFITYIVKKRRAINLKGIANQFIELYRQERNIVLTKLETVGEVDEETEKRVKEIVHQYTGKEVELSKESNTDILGGFSIEFENNMYDARVSTALNKLRKEFSKNAYESQL